MLLTLLNYQRLFHLLDSEIYLALWGLFILAWGFYKFFLKDVSIERHQNLARHYTNIKYHLFIITIFFITYFLISQYNASVAEDQAYLRTAIILAICTYVWGIIVLVKILRTMVLQYLFLGSMTLGVPQLIVNIFSLSFTIAITAWSLNFFLGIHLAPILATSAAVSIILGLALQDTLGNLFAGISLQIDKSFEIGNWVEIYINGQKVTGQVREITWRATALLGFSDELIYIPNRLMAQSQVANFSTGLAIYRRLVFRFDNHYDMIKVKRILLDTLFQSDEILKTPEPLVFISDITDSWTEVRACYAIYDYGKQYGIADKLYNRILAQLGQNDIKLAHSKLIIASS